MENKNVLIVAPFFAPQTHAAVFRAFKMAKYLKRFDWHPIVLTVDTNYTYLEDEDMIREIQGVPIYKAKYIEPTLRGLLMTITKMDRSYKNNRPHISNKDNSEDSPATERKSFLHKCYYYLLERYFMNPDRFRFWEKRALKEAVKLIRNQNIGIVFTTASPYSALQLGDELKKKTGVKWVADFRDPLTYACKTYSFMDKVYNKQKKIIINTLKNSDFITFTSPAYSQIFLDMYGNVHISKSRFIPTGVDNDYIPEIKDIEKDNTLAFVGEYLLEYGDEFLKSFANFLLNSKLEVKLKIIGNIDINKNTMMPILKNLRIEDKIIFIDHLSQKKLYHEIKKSMGVLLITGSKAHWWNIFAKLIDYIGLELPVLALLPETSVARTELEKAGLGIFLNHQNFENILTNIVEGKISISPDKEYCKRYLASTQVNEFIKVFKSL